MLQATICETRAKILLDSGESSDALLQIKAAEGLLRSANSTLSLAEVLCTRAEVELALDKKDDAQERLDEASRIGATLGLGPNSGLGLRLDTLEGRAATIEGETGG